MNIRVFFNEKIILPLSDILTGQSISSKLKFLKKSQYWTREQLDNYQNIKLQNLIHHAYENVPYYNELFKKHNINPEDIKTKKDLEKIPISTKEDLKNAKELIFAKNLNRKNLIYLSSSGSTGEPFQFFSTKESYSFNTAANILGWYNMGYKLGDKYVKVSMNPRSSLLKKIQDKLNNCLYLSSNQLNEENFRDILIKVKKFNPKVIRCYPTPLKFLAQLVNNTSNSKLNSKLQAINTTGSTLHQEDRLFIEGKFGVKIFDSYSCEGGSTYFQCNTCGKYHPCEEFAISEFIEDSYSKNNTNSPKRHITTDLTNYATPFIRYDTQDYLVLAEENKCSKPYLSVKNILGRDSDILKTPSGKYLIVENFVAYFEWITEVEQIQIIQNEINKISINLIVNNKFNNQTFEKIKNYWQDYIGEDVELSINIVEEIKLTPTGKRRTVIRSSNIKI